MSPFDWASLVTGMNFALGSYEKFQPSFRDERSGAEIWHQIRETRQTWQNTLILTFAPIITSATLKAVSLQLIGFL